MTGIFLINGLYPVLVVWKLKEKIQESLTGRKRMFELSPVSFEEMLNYKTEYRYENNLPDFFKIESHKTEELLLEYLNFWRISSTYYRTSHTGKKGTH